MSADGMPEGPRAYDEAIREIRRRKIAAGELQPIPGVDVSDPPFVPPRPWCLSCALAKWNAAGKGVCLASTHEIRKPRWHELGQDKPTIWRHAPLDDCWRFEPIRGVA